MIQDEEPDHGRSLNEVLMQLALDQRRPVEHLDQGLASITEGAAHYTGVERVGVWLVDETRTLLRCIDCYDRGEGRHTSGYELRAADFPAYFRALEGQRVIDAADAREDPRTREFAESYLEPNGILSMLDAPVFVEDEARGVVCFEAVGRARPWSERDKTFSGSVADLVAALLASFERREASRAVSALLETASQGVVFLNDDGRILRTNRAAAEMLGAPVEELDGSQIERFLPRSEETDFLYALLVDGGELPRSRPVTARRADGGEFAAELSVGRSRYRAKRVTLLMLSDVSERVADQARLREREELYHDVVEDLTAFVLRVAPGGRITFANRAACEYFGTTLEEACRRTVYDFSPEEDHAHIRGTAAKLTPQKPVRNYEARGILPGGDVILCEWTLRGLFDDDGKLRGYQTIGRDVSRERRQEALLREAQRMESLAVLAGGISHDFNNLLTPILGYTELVAGRLDPASREVADLQRVMAAGTRARDLVRQVLVFSRRKSSQERAPIAVGPYLRDTLSFLRASIPSRVSMEVEVPEDVGTVSAAPADLYQVLSNLCTNAYQAMPAGGLWTVSASQVNPCRDDENGFVQIVVRDTGHGIPDADRERIFEPFFTNKPTGEGTGLGLSVVHGIVHELGGRIDVQSRPGATSFVVYLPCVPPQGEVARSSTEGPESWTGTERVLVVDDESDVGALARSGLEPAGYRVDVRSSANEALAAFQRDPSRYDVLVTDFTMPYMTGIELTWQVRRKRPDLPVVLLSGFASLLSEDEIEAGGIDVFVQKPFRVEELGLGIRRAVEKRRKGG